MTSREKIKSIKSLINEFYHNEKCEGRLTECANDCWKSYQKDCDEIEQKLDRLEKLEKENEALKFQNKRLFEDNDFMSSQNRMLEDVVKLFKRNLYASILDNNMPKHKTEELLQLLDKVLGGISIIYE